MSDPGRPGYSFDPSQYPSSVPEITCPVTDTNEIKYASEIAPIPSASSASSRVSPPVRKKLDRGRDSTQKDDQPSSKATAWFLLLLFSLMWQCQYQIRGELKER